MTQDKDKCNGVDRDALTAQLISEGRNVADGYFDYAAVVARRLPKHLHEQLMQLVGGPVWDGDIICKSHRGELFTLGLAVRVCCDGEQGYTGATYFAYSVNKIINEISTGKRG